VTAIVDDPAAALPPQTENGTNAMPGIAPEMASEPDSFGINAPVGPLPVKLIDPATVTLAAAEDDPATLSEPDAVAAPFAEAVPDISRLPDAEA